MPSYLFVYGTLRRGSENEYARLLAARGQFIGAARVAGTLYDLGRYPGARPENGSIVGEIFELEDALLAALDEYEGPEFQRAMTATSDLIDCWIYWYIGPAEGHLIPSGDWMWRTL